MKHNCEACRSQKRTTFCLLEESEWGSFVNTRTSHQFQARQIVFHEGMPASTVYILCSGRVKLSLKTPQGTTHIVKLLSGHLHPCEILDKPALGRSVHSVTCETLTEAQIACLDKTYFDRLIKHNHQFTLLVLNMLIAETASYLAALREGSGTARQRTAKLLITLSETQAKERGNGASGDGLFPLRRQEMAELLGTARETLVRLLGSFHREGLIAVTGQHIEIRALDRLRRLAGLKLRS
jgi:CRP/FNR family transcriptional regulator